MVERVLVSAGGPLVGFSLHSFRASYPLVYFPLGGAAATFLITMGLLAPRRLASSYSWEARVRCSFFTFPPPTPSLFEVDTPRSNSCRFWVIESASYDAEVATA